MAGINAIYGHPNMCKQMEACFFGNWIGINVLSIRFLRHPIIKSLVTSPVFFSCNISVDFHGILRNYVVVHQQLILHSRVLLGYCFFLNLVYSRISSCSLRISGKVMLFNSRNNFLLCSFQLKLNSILITI